MGKQVSNVEIVAIIGFFMLGQVAQLILNPPSTPTVVPAAPFDEKVIDAVVQALHDAVDGLGTKEAVLNDIITICTYDQRKRIADAYKTKYNDEIISHVCDDTEHNYEDIVTSMFKSPNEIYANNLRASMKGFGTDDFDLIQILVALSKSAELKNEVKKLYKKSYDSELLGVVEDDTKGVYEKVLRDIIEKDRKPNVLLVDVHAAKREAEALPSIIKNMKNDDEKENAHNLIHEILIVTPLNQLKEVTKEYKNLHNRELHEDLDEAIEGNLGEVYRQLAYLAANEYRYYADLAHRATDGGGTEDSFLIRLAVINCEIDLRDIELAFDEMFSKTLQKVICEDTSGDYKDFIMALLGPEKIEGTPLPKNLLEIPAVKEHYQGP